MSNKILILGASGFIGNVLYKELLSYYDVYGTYFTQEGNFGDNKVFYKYNLTEGGLDTILATLQPDVVISCISGNFEAQLTMFKLLCDYSISTSSKLLFFSSAEIFNAKGQFPSYESDIPFSNTPYGKFKISVERLLKKLPKENYAILRLPFVLGVNAPILHQLKQSIKNRVSFDVYPNLIISVTTADKIAQQVHYIINKNLFGTFHLASNDMVHHEDIMREISEKISDQEPTFKGVYISNDDTYLAILPKENKLPKAYRITVAEVIDDCTLREEINTFKS